MPLYSFQNYFQAVSRVTALVFHSVTGVLAPESKQRKLASVTDRDTQRLVFNTPPGAGDQRMTRSEKIMLTKMFTQKPETRNQKKTNARTKWEESKSNESKNPSGKNPRTMNPRIIQVM